MSTTTVHVKFLDGWRGVAILTVLLGHFTPWGQLGPLGVELFFVLSGRLMADILFERQTPLGTFYWRRFSRIVPALFVFILAMMPASWVAARLLHKSLFGPIQILGALTFTTNYVEAIGHFHSVFDHTWSLAVEEHSYIILGILALLTARKKGLAGWVAAAVAVLCMLNGLWLSSGMSQATVPHDVYWRSDVRIASVFASASVYLLLSGRTLPAWASIFALLVSIVVVTALPPQIGFTVGTLGLAVAVNGLESAPQFVRLFLSNTVLVWAGTLSYSLYIWQQPFYFAQKLAPPIVLVLALLVIAIGSYFIVERPARAWLNARAPFKRSRRPTALPA